MSVRAYQQDQDVYRRGVLPMDPQATKTTVCSTLVGATEFTPSSSHLLAGFVLFVELAPLLLDCQKDTRRALADFAGKIG